MNKLSNMTLKYDKKMVEDIDFTEEKEEKEQLSTHFTSDIGEQFFPKRVLIV